MKKSSLSQTDFPLYFKKYIDLVEDRPLLEALYNNSEETTTFFKEIPEKKHLYRYAFEKWTPKEILLHMIDTERIFCYRALFFARSENSNLIGFDENEFAKNSNANSFSMEDLLIEYKAVRNSTITLFKNFDEEILKKMGKANNYSMSVCAAGFVIRGHEIHHINIIKERYL